MTKEISTVRLLEPFASRIAFLFHAHPGNGHGEDLLTYGLSIGYSPTWTLKMCAKPNIIIASFIYAEAGGAGLKTQLLNEISMERTLQLRAYFCRDLDSQNLINPRTRFVYPPKK